MQKFIVEQKIKMRNERCATNVRLSTIDVNVRVSLSTALYWRVTVTQSQSSSDDDVVAAAGDRGRQTNSTRRVNPFIARTTAHLVFLI